METVKAIPNMQMPYFLSIKETAAYLDLPEGLVRRLVQQRKIKVFRSGVKFYCNIQSLLDYLHAQEE